MTKSMGTRGLSTYMVDVFTRIAAVSIHSDVTAGVIRSMPVRSRRTIRLRAKLLETQDVLNPSLRARIGLGGNFEDASYVIFITRAVGVTYAVGNGTPH